MTAARHRATEDTDPAPPWYEIAYRERRIFRVEQAFAAIAALHVVGEYGTCACCAWPYPCETVQYIWGAEADRG